MSGAEKTILLSARNITKKFGGVMALDSVSIELRRGEVLALAGDNGAGKSTLTKIISGVYQPDNGDINFDGKKIEITNPGIARNIGIETIYQDLALSDNLDVGANVFLGREPIKRIFGISIRIDRPFLQSAAQKLLENLDIEICPTKMWRPVGIWSRVGNEAIQLDLFR